jgi:hydroxymethylpyrimidine pyrophosphatase-like HAD family hydrolase
MSAAARRCEPVPRPEDALLLFDLDMTLIDSHYSLSPNREFLSSVHRAIDAGWVLGLSSDTPQAGIEYWRQRLGFNGPMVVEKGAALSLIGEPALPINERTRTLGEMVYHLTEALSVIADRVWIGDAPGAIRDGLVVGESGEEIIMVNALREFSFSLYGGRVDERGLFAKDAPVLERAVDMARKYHPTTMVLDEDVSHDYGIYIVHDAMTTKRAGTKALARHRQAGRIGMVGNSMTDFVGSDIAVHYAVANASADYRAIADYTTDQPLTIGCGELLQQLVKESNT